MYTLYFAPGTCALASHIALAEAGADYELKRLDFSKSEQRTPDYLAVNPKGRVPALVTPQGTLTETPAILVYVAQTYPEANLAPLDNAFAFARLQSFNSFLCSTLHINHAHGRRGARWADDEAAIESMKKKTPETVLASFEMVENGMLAGPWVMGDDYTIADIYLFTVAQWIEPNGIDPARLPRVAEHRRRMMDRPAVAKAVAEEKAG